MINYWVNISNGMIYPVCCFLALLTHWGRVTHMCVCRLNTIGSENGLSAGRRQAIIWTNAEILLIWTNFNEILIKIHTFSFEKTFLEMSSAKWRPLCCNPQCVDYCDNIYYPRRASTDIVKLIRPRRQSRMHRCCVLKSPGPFFTNMV